MRHRTRHSRWKARHLFAALLVITCFTSHELRAGKPNPLAFTIKADHDARVSDPDTFTVIGAIEDSGIYEVEWQMDEELFPLGWNLFRFTGSKGTFFVGYVPSFSGEFIESGVEYPVELFPGTGAYADAYGSGTMKIRAKEVYDVDSLGEKYLVGRIEHITIKGALLP